MDTSQKALIILLSAVSLAATSCSNLTDPEAAKLDKVTPVVLFDGESFAGWEGNLDVFRIEDGAIVGGTLEKAVAHNDFLCTTREYGDFELRLKFKLLGPAKGVNAGIQFRSRRVPNHHEVSGYQADMGYNYWGCLYDEHRRNKVLVKVDQEMMMTKILRPGRWNDYVIRAVGDHIQLWVNGHKTVDYIERDENIERTGIIGLQIHGGPPTEAWYKDITIREIRR